MRKYLPKGLKLAFIALVLVFVIGIAGYVIIEKYNFIEALFMTVITLTTVGFGEVKPLTNTGRIFTILILFFGFGILMYVITVGISFLIEGELGALMRRRKMEKEIKNLKNHFIICAKGETSEYVIEEFIKTEQPCVVVTADKDLYEKLSGSVNVIFDNPAEDKVLEKAGIKNAKGLVSCLEDDRFNLFVVLSARGLNSNLRIVSQALERETIGKLHKAGADEVISTTTIGGMRIASAMLRPAVVSFLDKMLYESEVPLRVEEATVEAESVVENKTLSECKIHEETGLLVVAIKENQTGKYIYNPNPEYKLNSGDTLIVIGNIEQMKKLHLMTESKSRSL